MASNADSSANGRNPGCRQTVSPGLRRTAHGVRGVLRSPQHRADAAFEFVTTPLVVFLIQ